MAAVAKKLADQLKSKEFREYLARLVTYKFIENYFLSIVLVWQGHESEKPASYDGLFRDNIDPGLATHQAT